MNASPQINRFIDFFTSNASGVLGTITNQSINFDIAGFDDFDFSQINTGIEIPCVLLSIMYTGQQNFQLQLVIDKNAVSTLADLMMLGEGEAEYIPDEHNDAMKEMCNQILGSMTAEFSGEGINLTGNVGDIELTDMEIQQDFFIDNKMLTLQFSVVGKKFQCYLIFDNQSIESINNSFSADDVPSFSSNQTSFNTAPKKQEEPVRVSRAQFSEFEEVRPSSGKNINIDLLLDVSLPVTVELGRKDMKIKEVLEIGQGSVVELDKLAGDLVDLMINGKKFAVGEVMVADDNYAVRIVSLVSREERIRSLGSD